MCNMWRSLRSIVNNVLIIIMIDNDYVIVFLQLRMSPSYGQREQDTTMSHYRSPGWTKQDLVFKVVFLFASPLPP